MIHTQPLLYKSIKATVCTGAVALATIAFAQTPWQAAPASPASLTAKTASTTTPQSGNSASPSQASAKEDGISTNNQKQAINRYAPVAQPTLQVNSGAFAQQQLQHRQLQPTNSMPSSNPQSPAAPSAQLTFGPPYSYPSANQPQTQYGTPIPPWPVDSPARPSFQYPLPSQVQNQAGQVLNQPSQLLNQQVQTFPPNRPLLYQPPSMVPFNPTSANAAVADGGYIAVDLPPPGAEPNLPASQLKERLGNQPLAQDLMNAIHDTPLNLRPSTNGGTSPPQQSIASNDQTQVPNVSPNSSPRLNSPGLPGASQLLPRSGNISTPAGNLNQLVDSQRVAAQDNIDPDAFQGRIPTIDDLPVPDLTAIDSTKHLLVGLQRNPDNGPRTSEPWNTKLVAIVGDERVLAGDMAAVIEPIIIQNAARLRSKKEEVEARLMLVRQLLPEYVSMKALQQQFFKDIAGNVPPKELRKKRDEIMSKASKAFYDKYVPIELYRKYKVDDLAELESKLRESGLSINIMKNHFLMQVLAMQCEDKYVASSFEILPGEILDYYEKNVDKWRIPARVKWRELVIRFDKHSSKDEARNLINSLGNEVFLTGKPFEAVARDSSEGHNAKEGGLYDWTSAGSLKSEVIDKALFNLPLRRLSEVIEDDIGYHIVEVLEREPARIQEMSEIQSEIRTKLSNDMRAEKLKEFRQKILLRTPVWSLWPDDIPGSKPLVDVQETD